MNKAMALSARDPWPDICGRSKAGRGSYADWLSLQFDVDFQSMQALASQARPLAVGIMYCVWRRSQTREVFSFLEIPSRQRFPVFTFVLGPTRFVPWEGGVPPRIMVCHL